MELFVNGESELASLSIQPSTFRTQRLTAGSISNVLAFNVVVGVTLGVVMMNVRFHRMPWRFSRHGCLLYGDELLS